MTYEQASRIIWWLMAIFGVLVYIAAKISV